MRTLNSVSSAFQLLAVAICAVGALSGCSNAPKVRSDQDSRADFASYKTFAWLDAKQSAPPPSDVKKLNETAEAQAKRQEQTAASNSLMSRRARTALVNALQAKGLTLDEAKPDVRVSHLLHVYDRPRQSGMRIGLGVGGGSGNVGGGAGLSLPVGKRTETVAAMTIDIVDVSRNSQVWTGSFETVIKEQTATDADVQNLVDKILTKYPVGSK